MRAVHLLLPLVLSCIPHIYANVLDAELGLDPQFAAASVNATADEATLDASGAGPLVDLGYAKYEGVADETTGTTRFLGMRYAVPPTGQFIRAIFLHLALALYLQARHVCNGWARMQWMSTYAMDDGTH